MASNDLVIIEQEADVETRYVQIAGTSNDPIVPRCAPSQQNKTYAQIEVLVQRVKTMHRVDPVNGKEPTGRYCHQSCLIGCEPGQKPYLAVYAGLDNNRHTLGDLVLFDVLNSIWIPVAQSGFIPENEQGQFGRYNFGMAYEPMLNQIVVFGGQSNKGTFCKPQVH